MAKKNKYSVFAKVAGKWMHVFSWPTKAEAEKHRRFYKRNHPGRRTKIRPIGDKG